MEKLREKWKKPDGKWIFVAIVSAVKCLTIN